MVQVTASVRDNFVEILYNVSYRCVIDVRSLIQRETRYVGTVHNCGKLKGNAADKRSRLYQR